MTTVLKLRDVGNSVGTVFPKEVLTLLNSGAGDSVFVTRTPGGVTLTPYDPAVEEQVRLGREIMREYRDTLRALAK
ncbi:MAG: AbrB/MazE/SpoVT family DNA-binding domain-containing protein [Alphaproteobacteria bacterium]